MQAYNLHSKHKNSKSLTILKFQELTQMLKVSVSITALFLTLSLLNGCSKEEQATTSGDTSAAATQTSTTAAVEANAQADAETQNEESGNSVVAQENAEKN